MNETLRIPGERPLTAKRLMETLTSTPKLAILKILYREGAKTAGELSEKLGLKLPTILSHLNDLVRTGIVVLEHNGRRKRYVLAAEKIMLEIDLRTYLELDEKLREEELREIEYLAYRYVEAKRRGKGLPLTITVKDVADTLGVDKNTAIAIVDYINTYTDDFIELLVKETLEVIRKYSEGLTLRELSEKLNIHYYWVALIVQKLVSKSYVKVEGEKVIPYR